MLYILDIGMLSKNGDLHSLPQHTKLELLNHTPDPKFNYPTKYVHGCNRRFKPEWPKNHSWLHYSPSEDGVYCKACALFAPADIRRQTLGILVSKPFSLWTKQSSVFLSHEQNQYHQPVTTCETERSNSQLKLLKTYLRSTMTEERLSALAIIKVHRSMVEDLNHDELVVAFANKHTRRMALPCVLINNCYLRTSNAHAL